MAWLIVAFVIYAVYSTVRHRSLQDRVDLLEGYLELMGIVAPPKPEAVPKDQPTHTISRSPEVWGAVGRPVRHRLQPKFRGVIVGFPQSGKVRVKYTYMGSSNVRGPEDFAAAELCVAAEDLSDQKITKVAS